MVGSQAQLLLVSQECLSRWGPASLWGAYPHMWALLSSCAAQENRHALAAFLISKNIPLDVPDKSGFLPLDIAVQESDTDLIKALVRGGARVSPGRGIQRLFSSALVYFNQEEAEIIWSGFSSAERNDIWMRVYSMTATAYLSSRPAVSQKLMEMLREDWPRYSQVGGSVSELVSRWGVVFQTAKLAGLTWNPSLLDLSAMISWSFRGRLPREICELVGSTIEKKTNSPLGDHLSQLLGLWQAQFEVDSLEGLTPCKATAGQAHRL